MAAGQLTLVTGGIRSGKSRHAESLLRDEPEVLYVATGPRADDPGHSGSDAEWSDRVRAHRDRRPPGWRVAETLAAAEVVQEATEAVVLDCLGTWVTGLVDAADAWEDLARASRLVTDETRDLLRALALPAHPIVVVTNEVGLAPVALTPSGRWFQDELGRLNAAVARIADAVHLVVVGRVLDLSDARPVG